MMNTDPSGRPPREFLGTEAYRDLRRVYCLQNGLPLGIETVDLAKIGLRDIGDAGPQQTIGQSKEG